MTRLERVTAAARNRERAEERFRKSIIAAVAVHTVRDVARAASLSPGRISQIANDAP